MNSKMDISGLQPVEARRTVLADDRDYTVTKMCCAIGLGPEPHSHPHKQLVYILKGRGLFRLGEALIEVGAGELVQIGPNVPHTFHHVSEEIEWLEFFTPGREDWR